MAITAQASGTQTATVTTEHTLSTINVAGCFQLFVDTVNLVDGDVLELRVYKIVLTGGVSRVASVTRYMGAQPTDDLIKFSVPMPNELTDTDSVKFTLKQTFGTSRNFPWVVLKLG